MAKDFIFTVKLQWEPPPKKVKQTLILMFFDDFARYLCSFRQKG